MVCFHKKKLNLAVNFQIKAQFWENYSLRMVFSSDKSLVLCLVVWSVINCRALSSQPLCQAHGKHLREEVKTWWSYHDDGARCALLSWDLLGNSCEEKVPLGTMTLRSRYFKIVHQASRRDELIYVVLSINKAAVMLDIHSWWRCTFRVPWGVVL